MAQTVDTTLQLIADILTQNPLDQSTPLDQLLKKIRIRMATGTGSGQASQVFHDTRSLNATSESLDFAGGSLTNPLGVALTFTKIKAIIVKVSDTAPGNFEISRPNLGLTLFGADLDKITLEPGGLFVWVSPGAGITVGAGASDLLKIENLGATATYDIIVVGV